MNIFKVTGGVLHTAPGAALLLTAAQVADRRHALANIQPMSGVFFAHAASAQDFVVGDVVGLSSEWADHLHTKEVVTNPDEGSSEGALVRAAQECAATLPVGEAKHAL